MREVKRRKRDRGREHCPEAKLPALCVSDQHCSELFLVQPGLKGKY